jgi:LAO/AO transport system kinase
MECSLEQLVDDARAGGPRSLRAAARLMSVMTDEPQRLAEMLAGSRDWPQPRLVLGVTGAPGSGKSTLVDHLAAEHRNRFPQHRLGIVAVDPSSPFTGGALLGDRVRMMRHATDPGVFIRSLASRGRLGGLALGAKGVVRVMGLIGCDVVIVETVGVGQSEIEVAQNADVTVVVLAPGQGDSIQMLKAGLIEAGDVFVVNKADRDDAARLHQQLLSALQRGRRTPLVGGVARASRHNDRDDKMPVFLCSAVNHQGIDELVKHLETLAVRHAGAWQIRRKVQAMHEIRDALMREVEQRVDTALGRPEAADGRISRLLSGDATIGEMAVELMRDAVGGSKQPPRCPADHVYPDGPICQGNSR